MYYLYHGLNCFKIISMFQALAAHRLLFENRVKALLILMSTCVNKCEDAEGNSKGEVWKEIGRWFPQNPTIRSRTSPHWWSSTPKSWCVPENSTSSKGSNRGRQLFCWSTTADIWAIFRPRNDEKRFCRASAIFCLSYCISMYIFHRVARAIPKGLIHTKNWIELKMARANLWLSYFCY